MFYAIQYIKGINSSITILPKVIGIRQMHVWHNGENSSAQAQVWKNRFKLQLTDTFLKTIHLIMSTLDLLDFLTVLLK